LSRWALPFKDGTPSSAGSISNVSATCRGRMSFARQAACVAEHCCAATGIWRTDA